jgi:hypothetical protein
MVIDVMRYAKVTPPILVVLEHFGHFHVGAMATPSLAQPFGSLRLSTCATKTFCTMFGRNLRCVQEELSASSLG